MESSVAAASCVASGVIEKPSEDSSSSDDAAPSETSVIENQLILSDADGMPNDSVASISTTPAHNATADSSITAEGVSNSAVSSTRAAKRKAEALEVCVHRRPDGGWVISRINDAAPLELQTGVSSERRRDSVVWRLDDEVFAATERDASSAGSRPAPKKWQGSVSKRLRHAAIDLMQLQTAANTLQETLENFREEKAAFAKEKCKLERELDDHRSELTKRELALKEERAEVDAAHAKLARDRLQFSADANEAGEFLAAALQTPVYCPSGEVAMPAEAFFAAAQGEFGRAVPPLDESHRLRMVALKAAPNMELSKAKEVFLELPSSGSASLSEVDLQRRIEAVVHAFWVAECMERSGRVLETLAGMASALASLANKSGRLALAFAASCCAVWCAFHLADSMSLQWAEVNAPLFLKDLEAWEEVGILNKQGLARNAHLLVQYGEKMQRLQQYWAAHGDHRRRFIRFFSSKANGKGDGMPLAVEADLRLLLMPTSATPRELALQLERVKNLVDPNATASRLRRRQLLHGGSSTEAVKAA